MAELTISYPEVVVRLLISAALCGAIGIEREMRDEAAGFRTHMLLGLGATLFTLVSAYGFPAFTEAALESGGIQFDPTRITAQIVTGVGFLGAGAIIRQGTDIRGLTTAASLWAAAAIGTAAGAGYIFGAVVTTAVVVAALYLLREVRNRFLARFAADSGVLKVAFSDIGGSMSEVTETLERHGVDIRSLSAEIEDGRSRYTIQIRIPPRRGLHEALEEISSLSGVERLSVTGLREVE